MARLAMAQRPLGGMRFAWSLRGSGDELRSGEGEE